MTEPLLRLDGINTFYGAVQAHFDLSLEVGRGRIVCLLGGNASGKSTTMKVILGLVAPRSGVGHAGRGSDQRPADASDHPRRRRLGARGAANFPADDGARESGDGRLCPKRPARCR